MSSNAMRTVSLRNLAAHKLRLLLTVVAVILGTAFIAGSFVFTDTLKSTFDGIITTSDKGIDVRVQTSKSTSAGVPVALVSQLSKVAGVKAAQISASAPIVLLGSDGKKVQSGGAPAIGGNWTPADQSITPPPNFVAGSAPTTANQVVVNEGAAKKGHLKVGDQVTVITLSHGPVKATLSGIYHTDSETGGYIGALFTEQQALRLFTDGVHIDNVDLSAQSGVSQNVLRDRVANQLPSDLKATTGDQVRKDDQDSLQKALSFINYFLLAFGAIALLVGTFIIYNTFSMIVAQRLRELALLRAIGASRKQVRRAVVFEAAVIGFIGSVIGVAGGIALAFGLRAFLDAVGSGLPSGGLTLSARTVIVSLVVGTGVTLLSAYSPARRASKIAPVAAMREEFATTTAASLRRRNIIGSILLLIGVVATVAGATASSSATGAGLIGLGLLGSASGVLMLAPLMSRAVIGVLGSVIGRPFGTVGRLARTNSVRNPRRTAATAFALTLGLMLVSAISVIGASTKASLNGLVDNDVRADYLLTGSAFGVPTGAAQAAAKAPGVASVTQIRSFVVLVNGSQESGSAIDGPLLAVARVNFSSGGGEPTGSTLIVSKTQAKDKHWVVGSTVTFSVAGGNAVIETVGGIYADNPLLGAWNASGQSFRTLIPNSQEADDVALVRAVPGTNLQTLRTSLETATDPYYVVDVQNRNEFKGTQAGQVNGLLGVLYGLLGLAIVIAILGIINTLALSVVERRREIGMLRAIGMQRKQVRRTIYVESALIAMFGAVLGLAIGLTYGVLFTRLLASQGLKTLSVPWGQAVLFFVVAGVVGVLAALWPGIRAARIPPLAAITEG
jgi:putative ABC transport system permease protein